MKNKILLFSLIIITMALIVTFSFTNARYFSTALITGDLNNIKVIGTISLYHPEWIGGYIGASDGSGVFKVESIPTEFNHIHYIVTNSNEGIVNDSETPYYIRVVAEDGSSNIPIEYNVHEYNNSNNIYDEEIGVGYGPFILNAGTEESKEYSLKINCNQYVYDTYNLKVQMVRKKDDGSIKVIDEAPLILEFSGSKFKVHLMYYLYGTATQVASSQELRFNTGFTLDFTNNEQLDSLGIIIPNGHYFHDIRYNINGTSDYTGTATSITFPNSESSADYYIEVYLLSETNIALQLTYYPSGSYEPIPNSTQTIIVPRGVTISFSSSDEREKYGINIPKEYMYYEMRYNNSVNTYNSLTTPLLSISDSESATYDTLYGEGSKYILSLRMVLNKSSSNLTLILNYCSSSGEDNCTESIGNQTLNNVYMESKIDFSDSVSLQSQGINLPEGYEFDYAYSNELYSGEHRSVFILSNTGTNIYTIYVYLKPIKSVINVPVKFYNSDGVLVNETSVTMKNDGTYDFTTTNCRLLSPELSTMTSFTIYIANQWGSTYDNVGNTNNGTVIVDYNATYTSWTDFKLTDEGSYIYIKAWW